MIGTCSRLQKEPEADIHSIHIFGYKRISEEPIPFRKEDRNRTILAIGESEFVFLSFLLSSCFRFFSFPTLCGVSLR